MSVQTDLDASWQQTVAKGICVIDFFATWCGPCRMMAPIFESVADEYAQKPVRFFKVDVDQLPDMAAAFGVQSIPTLILLKDGVEQEVRVGVTSPAALRKILDEALA